MKLFQELIDLCDCEVSINVNEHKSDHLSVEEYFKLLSNIGCVDEDDLIHLDNMIEKDMIINVRAYPSTPVGFYQCFHHDLEKAIDHVLELVKDKKNGHS